MNNKVKIGLFLAGIAAILLVVIYLISNGGEAQDKKSFSKTRPVNWTKNYSAEKKSPYGAFLFYKLISKFYSDLDKYELEKNEYKKLKEQYNGKQFILFKISDELYLPYDQAEQLMEFTAEGNSVFISANYFGDVIESLVKKHFEIYTRFQKSTEHRFVVPALDPAEKYPHYFYNEKGITGTVWSSFSQNNIESPYVPSLPVRDHLIGDPGILIFNERKDVTFVRIPYGKGYFFLHTTPVAFSNISLLQEKNVEYLEKVLSCLPENDWIWEQLSEPVLPPLPDDLMFRRRESPLMFILSQPALKWAYYLLLATLFIFILFRMKRRQRVIPGMQKHENSAVEFADTLSKLYFEQGKHASLIRQKEKLLYHFIRKRYFIYSKFSDPKFIPLLTVKSNIRSEHLNKMFELYESAAGQKDITDEQLLEIHSLTDYFYKNCK